MKRKKIIAIVGGIFLLLMSVTLPFLAVCEALPPKPDIITWATYDIGASTYIQAQAVAEGIYKKSGVKIRVIPLGNDMSRMDACRARIAQFLITGMGPYFARRAEADWAAAEWGSQALRAVWQVAGLRGSAFAMATQGDSGIKVPADLKGRKVGFVVGSRPMNVLTEAVLAFADLTWDDVKVVEFPSTRTMYQAIRDGVVKAGPSASMGSFMYELSAKPCGINWITMDPKDTEAWERAKAVYPPIRPIFCKHGAGLKENPKWVSTVPHPGTYCYEWVDEGLAYWQTKLIHESFDEYKDISAQMAWWHKEGLFASTPNAPWHKGAIRYFQELGIWKAEIEAINQQEIEKDRKIKELWDKTLDEALEKGVKAAEWKKLWLKKIETLQ